MPDQIQKIVSSGDAQKGHPAPVVTNVPLREGYAAPAAPPSPAVPSTSGPVSAVPPPPKK